MRVSSHFLPTVLKAMALLLALCLPAQAGTVHTIDLHGTVIEAELPDPLPMQVSTDGKTMTGGMPVVVFADPTPPEGQKSINYTPSPQAASQTPDSPDTSFSINYLASGDSDPWGASCDSFPAEARAAFDYAATIWNDILDSDVPITINACWSDLGSPYVLGYSGGAPLHKDFANAPRSDVWYDGSLANALAGADLYPSHPDMHITYNSGFSWYYGTDGNTPLNQYDLVTVVLHEIAHGLNFAGSVYQSGGTAYWGHSGLPYTYDVFMEDGSGTALTTYISGSQAFTSLTTSNDLWFDAPKSKEANGGSRVKMYAPSTWSGGSSYAHLDYNTFSGTSNRLMVYAISNGLATHDPGEVTKGLLEDIGWPMNTPGPQPTPTGGAVPASNMLLLD